MDSWKKQTTTWWFSCCCLICQTLHIQRHVFEFSSKYFGVQYQESASLSHFYFKNSNRSACANLNFLHLKKKKDYLLYFSFLFSLTRVCGSRENVSGCDYITRFKAFYGFVLFSCLAETQDSDITHWFNPFHLENLFKCPFSEFCLYLCYFLFAFDCLHPQITWSLCQLVLCCPSALTRQQYYVCLT